MFWYKSNLLFTRQILLEFPNKEATWVVYAIISGLDDFSEEGVYVHTLVNIQEECSQLGWWQISERDFL